MVTIGQVQNGLAAYLDAEIIPMLPGWRRFAFGTAAGLMLSRAGEMFERIKADPTIQMLGVIQPDDTIDIDALYSEAKRQIRKAPLTFDLPGAGSVTLRELDIDKIYMMINGG